MPKFDLKIIIKFRARIKHPEEANKFIVEENNYEKLSGCRIWKTPRIKGV